MRFSALILGWLLFFLLLPSSQTLGQAKKKETPTPAKAELTLPPQYPTLKLEFPYGFAVGEKASLSLGGSKLKQAQRVWLEGKAKGKVEKADEQKVQVSFSELADYPTGIYAARVITQAGVSNAVPVVVDRLPQVLKSGDLSKKETAMAVSLPSVVVGKLEEEKSDWYKISLEKGKKITLEVVARRLGLATDPFLKLYQAKNGREIPGAYADDTLTLQSDCRLEWTPPESGDYLIEVRDSQYRGGEDYGYRLRISTGPAAWLTEPLIVTSKAKTAVEFPQKNGPPLSGPQIQAQPGVGSVQLRPTPESWPVPTHVWDVPLTAEIEPNNNVEQAQKVNLPLAITGAFDQPRDVDFFRLSAKKDKAIRIRGEGYSLGSPAEVFFTLLDAKGKELAKSDPQETTAKVRFVPPADGDYLVRVEHLNLLHGPLEKYALHMEDDQPDFELRLALDRLVPVDAETGLLNILVERNGYTGAIQLEAVSDVPGVITGKGVIPANQNSGLVQVLSSKESGEALVPFRVKGTASQEKTAIVRWADRQADVRKDWRGLNFPPQAWGRTVVAVPKLQPRWTVTAKAESEDWKPGSKVNCLVTLKSEAKTTEDIECKVVGLPEGVSATTVTIKAGQKEATLTLTVDAKGAIGPVYYAVLATEVKSRHTQASPLMQSMRKK